MALIDVFARSNREWSRQFVDAPFFSRFAPAIELDLDGTTASDGQGQPRDVSGEDANIRAAQATLFRSRTKGTPSKEDKHGQTESKSTPRKLGTVTRSDGAAASCVEKGTLAATADGKLEATPVKAAMNGLARTPNGALVSSGSKQRCESLGARLLVFDKSCSLLQVKKAMGGSRVQYN